MAFVPCHACLCLVRVAVDVCVVLWLCDCSTYDTVYSNQFYHSSLDNSDHANAVRLLAHHTHRRGIC